MNGRKSSTTFLQSCVASSISEDIKHSIIVSSSTSVSIFHLPQSSHTFRMLPQSYPQNMELSNPGTVHFFREQSTDFSQIFGLYWMFGKFASLRIAVHCTLNQWLIVSGTFLQHISPGHLRSHEKQNLTQKEPLLETNRKLCISVTNGLSIMSVFHRSTFPDQNRTTRNVKFSGNTLVNINQQYCATKLSILPPVSDQSPIEYQDNERCTALPQSCNTSSSSQ